MLPVGLIAVLTGHKICDLLFRCGCGWLTIEDCNVHHHEGPRCPWCVESEIFLGAGATWLLFAGLGALLARKRFGRKLATTSAGAAAGFILGVLTSGAATVALTGYPRLLWWG